MNARRRRLLALVPFAALTTACGNTAPPSATTLGDTSATAPVTASAPRASRVEAAPARVAVSHGVRENDADSPTVITAQVGGCAPMQVAPGVWIAPDCSPARLAMRTSPFAARPMRAKSFHGARPTEVDLRREGLDGPVKSQEQVGICWAFAVSTVMDNAIRRAGGQDVIAPLHVLAADTWNDLWKHGRGNRELTVEPAWPYVPAKGCKLNEAKSEIWCAKAYGVEPGSWRSDSQLVAEVNRANESGVFRIARVEKLSTADEIATAVAEGKAAFASFEYNRDACADTGASGSVIADYTQTHGPHAVVIVGYRSSMGGRQFLLHNSWGTQWRDGGYAWISEAMVRSHLRDAFTVDVIRTGQAPAEQPEPATPTKPGSCPAGQARDAIFGWCAPLCPNGAARRAMLCSASPAASSCPAGQVADLINGSCASPCGGGLPPAAGLCAF